MLLIQFKHALEGEGWTARTGHLCLRAPLLVQSLVPWQKLRLFLLEVYAGCECCATPIQIYLLTCR